jgi:hypothetical protein
VIYLEFIERDRSIPSEIFRELVDQRTSWVEATADRMVLQLRRSWHLGPAPSFLAFWQIASIDRLDHWEAYFRSGAWQHNSRSRAMHRAIHIQRAGLYDELISGGTPSDGLYCIEFFEVAAGTGDDILLACIRGRSRRHAGVELGFLLRRIGFLGPDPTHLAVWAAATHRDIEELARDHEDDGVMRRTTTGIYREFGRAAA